MCSSCRCVNAMRSESTCETCAGTRGVTVTSTWRASRCMTSNEFFFLFSLRGTRSTCDPAECCACMYALNGVHCTLYMFLRLALRIIYRRCYSMPGTRTQGLDAWPRYSVVHIGTPHTVHTQPPARRDCEGSLILPSLTSNVRIVPNKSPMKPSDPKLTIDRRGWKQATRRKPQLSNLLPPKILVFQQPCVEGDKPLTEVIGYATVAVR